MNKSRRGERGVKFSFLGALFYSDFKQAMHGRIKGKYRERSHFD